jgi:hypothetical protein
MEFEYIYLFMFIIIIIILFIIFYYYYWEPSQSNLVNYKLSLLNDETIFDDTFTQTINVNTLVANRKTLYVPQLGYGLTFVWDMYIPTLNGNDKWQTSFNRIKPIISMMDSPVISYHPKKNYLSIVLKYRNNPFYAQFAEVKFENVKPQNWSNYIVIIENRNIKLFINKKMVAIKILPSVPVIYDIQSEISLGDINNNFQGKVRNMVLYPYPLSIDEIELV